MKKLRPLFLFLALAFSGCISANLDNYQLVTLAQINAKVRANGSSENDMFNEWRYAGSDGQYDYIYEYKPGVPLLPNTNFRYYKIDRGQYTPPPPGRYPFNPNTKTNTRVGGTDIGN